MSKPFSNLPLFFSVLGGSLACAQQETTIIPDEFRGLQFRPNGGKGPTYAGGMDYDEASDSIFLTGGTYATVNSEESSCFFGRVNLQSESLTQMVTYGTKTKATACTGVAFNVLGTGTQRNVILVGMTEPNGLLTDIMEDNIDDHEEFLQRGFAMDLATTASSDKFEFLGGATTKNFRVSYPSTVLAGGNEFWTVAMVSDNRFLGVKPDLDKVIYDEFPNYTPGSLATMNRKYEIHVEAFKYSRTEEQGLLAEDGDLSQTYESQWAQTLRLRNHKEIKGVDVAGIVAAGDENLFIVGTTFDVFRDAKGFVSKINRASNATHDSDWGQIFTPGKRRNFWITGACTDPTNPSHLYIVGATDGGIDDDGMENGKRPIHAVIAKLNPKNLQFRWATQLLVQAPPAYNGTAKATALGCEVVSSERIVYVAGTVEDGAIMEDAIDAESAGRDDIFVARLSTKDGILQWMQQTGSNGDDRLSRNGGIKADKHGNAIIYGDTTGDMFLMREGEDKENRFSDLFVMMFDKSNGVHKLPLPGPPIFSYPKRTRIPQSKEEEGSFSVIGGILLGAAAFVVTFLVCRRRHQPASNVDKQRTSLYDATAADLEYYDDNDRRDVKSLLINIFRRKRDTIYQQENLMYHDEPEDYPDTVLGNFHKNFSDRAYNEAGMHDIHIL